MDKNLLNKFTANQCSSKEIDEFFNWLEKYTAEKPEVRLLFRNYWNDIVITDSPADRLNYLKI